MGKSFAYLQENIPKWLVDIGRIEDQVTAMQDRLTTVTVSRSPFAKATPGSAASIRPGNMDAILEEETTPSTSPQKDPLQDRNTRPPSALSARLSSPGCYRSRTMVVVSYDGEMQKSLEQLVRAIGIGRSLLRKARLESKMNQLAALVHSSDEENKDDDEDENEERGGHSEQDRLLPQFSHRLRMPSTRARVAARTSGRLSVASALKTPVTLFEGTDKALELAQGLCEKAAHLTLREGDCRKELAQVRKGFDDVLQAAETEMIRCNAHKCQETPELQLHDTSDTSISSLETPCEEIYASMPMSMPALAPEPQAKVPLLAGLTPTPPEPNIYPMEVDEEEEDYLDFDMMPVRLTSRMHVRG